jgi:hypothetical protein
MPVRSGRGRCLLKRLPEVAASMADYQRHSLSAMCVFNRLGKVSKDFQNELTGGIVLDRDTFPAALTAFDAVVFLSSSDL